MTDVIGTMKRSRDHYLELIRTRRAVLLDIREEAERCQDDLYRAVRYAHSNGASWAELEEATGYSHRMIGNILKEAS